MERVYGSTTVDKALQKFRSVAPGAVCNRWRRDQLNACGVSRVREGWFRNLLLVSRSIKRSEEVLNESNQ